MLIQFSVYLRVPYIFHKNPSIFLLNLVYHHRFFQTPHWDASYPRLIDFAFCANLSKHVTIKRERVERVGVLPPRIRFLLLEILRSIIFWYFLGRGLMKYAIHLLFFLYHLPTRRKYYIIPKRFRILRPRLRRNYLASMHQTLSIIFSLFVSKYVPQNSNNILRIISMLQNNRTLVFTKVFPKSPMT